MGDEALFPRFRLEVDFGSRAEEVSGLGRLVRMRLISIILMLFWVAGSPLTKIQKEKALGDALTADLKAAATAFKQTYK